MEENEKEEWVQEAKEGRNRKKQKMTLCYIGHVADGLGKFIRNSFYKSGEFCLRS